VEVVLRSLELLDRQGIPVVFLLVGDGADMPRLRDLSRALGVDRHVRFVGAVPHCDIERYYSVLDAFVVSRLNLPVCRLVTPLKPLEAMSQQIATIVSDLPALTELVKPGERGLVFTPESAEDLAAKVRLLHGDPALQQQLARQAREWVLTHRTWQHVAERTEYIYKVLAA
jgi:glycosyltransferase involved in cell wall biosynthesis